MAASPGLPESVLLFCSLLSTSGHAQLQTSSGTGLSPSAQSLVPGPPGLEAGVCSAQHPPSPTACSQPVWKLEEFRSHQAVFCLVSWPSWAVSPLNPDGAGSGLARPQQRRHWAVLRTIGSLDQRT